MEDLLNRFMLSNWSLWQRAPISREAVRTGPDGIPAVFVRMYRHFVLSSYLNVAVNASLEEFEHEVLTHPVFLVQSAMKEGA
jgi:hypothetical protein